MADDKFLNVNASPVFVTGDDDSKKIKKNLIVVSFVSMFLYFGNVHINPASSFFGMQFSGLTEKTIHLGLFLVLIYLISHFLWHSFDSLQEWEVRSSATSKAFRRVLDDNIDEQVKPPMPEDPRNLSLYFWWSTQAGYMGNLSQEVRDCLEQLKDCSKNTLEYLHSEEGRAERDVDNVRHRLDECSHKLTEIDFSVRSAAGALMSDQVERSLARFDRRFHMWLRSQNIKWIVFEFVGPLFAALVAVYGLANLLAQ